MGRALRLPLMQSLGRRLTSVRQPLVPGWDVVLMLMAMLPAAVLRLWQLNAVGFRGDEAVYAGQAAILAGDDEMERWFILSSRGNSNFMIFQGILSVVYRVFGTDDLSARLVSAVFSILTVCVVYVIGRLLYGRSAGFFAAVALGMSSYAVALGRVALLDSTFTFFGALTIACMLMFCRSDRAVWMYGLVAGAALTMQTKVIGVLLLPVAMLFVLAAGMRPRLTLRRMAIAAAVGIVFLTPAWVQLATFSQITDFLSTSTTRSSGVPWHYYYSQLFSYEGTAMIIVYGAALARAAVRRSRDDLIPVLWLGVILLFLQLYPLKGFNYLLPVIPALALLTGRAAGEAWEGLVGWWATGQGAARQAVVGLATSSVVVGLVVGCVPYLSAALTEDSSAGLREAAGWLARHDATRAGTMTISHGSAQYVLPFYGGVDAYPFGRFRLATVQPGGEIVPAASGSAPDGGAPRDWLNYWPPRLINSGAVSYLVYYTGHLDDPPTQEQLAGATTQAHFQRLVTQYGGELVHTVNWNHEPRVYIYKVTKRLPYPVVDATLKRGRLNVTGQGFTIDSPVTVTYRQQVIARAKADSSGDVSLTLPAPRHRELAYHLVVTDAEGNDASATGLRDTDVAYAVSNGRVQVRGSGYAPEATVTVSSGGERRGRAVADEHGRFTFTYPLPTGGGPREQITATDEYGHTASVAGPPPAKRNQYVVRTGDSLSSIAEDAYGSGRYWRLIWRHNKTASATKLTDPNVIYPGMKLELPAKTGDRSTDGASAGPGGRP